MAGTTSGVHQGIALLSQPDHHRGRDSLWIDRVGVPRESPLQIPLLEMPLDLGHLGLISSSREAFIGLRGGPADTNAVHSHLLAP